MANSVDPDQMPHSVASDLGLHCLLRPVCPNTKDKYNSFLGSLKHMPGRVVSAPGFRSGVRDLNPAGGRIQLDCTVLHFIEHCYTTTSL